MWDTLSTVLGCQDKHNVHTYGQHICDVLLRNNFPQTSSVLKRTRIISHQTITIQWLSGKAYKSDCTLMVDGVCSFFVGYWSWWLGTVRWEHMGCCLQWRFETSQGENRHKGKNTVSNTDNLVRDAQACSSVQALKACRFSIDELHRHLHLDFWRLLPMQLYASFATDKSRFKAIFCGASLLPLTWVSLLFLRELWCRYTLRIILFSWTWEMVELTWLH